MLHEMSLRSLEPDERGIVTAINCAEPMRRRLLDIGLSTGTEVTGLYRAPSGDPTAYAICGAVVSLRGSDAEKIQVMALPNEKA